MERILKVIETKKEMATNLYDDYFNSYIDAPGDSAEESVAMSGSTYYEGQIKVLDELQKLIGDMIKEGEA